MSGSWYNKFRRITSNQLYFPEIDGIRFLAIVLVILFHTHGYFTRKIHVTYADAPQSHEWIDNFLSKGDRGVELFFVLSGFILCLPFAHQFINKGKQIVLKKYYLRRLTRLEPPYILAMTGIFLLQLLKHIYPASILVPHWLASLAYVHGVVYHMTPILTVVAWSLEVEIQFYIIAPLLFHILSMPRVMRRVILFTLIVGFTFLQAHYQPFSYGLTLYNFIQFFLTGILLADFYVSNSGADVLRQKWVVLLGIMLLAGICLLPVKTEFTARLFFPLMIGLFYLIVMKNDIVKSIFSYKAIPVIGGMCYSIYLLHYTIISVAGRYTIHIRMTNYYLPNLLLQIILLAIPILAFSTAFYYYIERPFMDNKWMKMLMKKDKSTDGGATGNI